ncbi:MAG: hypothetical protein IBJ09_09135 [Bacteroidia bacterium]|nr:hypothetical protein [Bacteroidia bacterium]
MFGCILTISLSFLLQSCGQGMAKRESPPLRNDSDTVVVRGVSTLSLIGNITRFEKEIRAFEHADSTQGYRKGAVLFLGSSSIRLWKTAGESFRPAHVINRGFGGATIAEVNYYYPRIVPKYLPRMIVFYCGENDLAHDAASVDSVFADYRRFFDAVNRDLPETRLVFLSVKDSPSRMQWSSKFADLNTRVQALESGYPNFSFVDVRTPLLNKNGQPDSALFRKDMLHLNAEGYTRWEKALKPSVKAILP